MDREELRYQGADLLINISNDGYLGPTAVMRQHLAKCSFPSRRRTGGAAASNEHGSPRMSRPMVK